MKESKKSSTKSAVEAIRKAKAKYEVETVSEAFYDEEVEELAVNVPFTVTERKSFGRTVRIVTVGNGNDVEEARADAELKEDLGKCAIKLMTNSKDKTFNGKTIKARTKHQIYAYN